eukprot:TRINITY_DN27124_c0_g1_i1.p1 TRINITY_DN27124_c0_g1~~TRINITY_DN27124_c0_g1_i1.p1  ORF type:complete len:263 (+),score=22.01 TRINITY_DN27124_c0_g1_i1:48-836(+)
MELGLQLTAATSCLHSYIFGPCAWLSVLNGFHFYVDAAVLQESESERKAHAGCWTLLLSALLVLWRLPIHRKRIVAIAYESAALERRWGNASGACVSAWLSTLTLDAWSALSFGVSAGSSLAYVTHQVSPFRRSDGLQCHPGALFATTIISHFTTRMIDWGARAMIVPVSAYLGMMLGPFISAFCVSSDQRRLEEVGTPNASVGVEVRRGECVICLDAPASYVMVRCGHLCVCGACADMLLVSDRKCPMCRQGFESVVRVFE